MSNGSALIHITAFRESGFLFRLRERKPAQLPESRGASPKQTGPVELLRIWVYLPKGKYLESTSTPNDFKGSA